MQVCIETYNQFNKVFSNDMFATNKFKMRYFAY